jgi:hypothetical protein
MRTELSAENCSAGLAIGARSQRKPTHNEHKRQTIANLKNAKIQT